MEIDVRQKAANIFIEAANYIEKHGWQVSGMSKYGQPRCSMGALDSVWPKNNTDSVLAKIMYTALYKELGGESLTNFNHKYKSGEAVCNLFKQTARSLRHS